MQEYETTWEQWLAVAVAEIRFRLDRTAVEGELRAHLEDKAADLQRIFPQLSPEQAQAQAVEEMGDAKEIARALGHIHRPWLGYLWRASRILRILLLVFLCMASVLNAATMRWHPLAVDWSYTHTRPEAVEPAKATLGGYTFEIIEAVYYPMEGTQKMQLRLRLRVSTLLLGENIAIGAIEDAVTLVGVDGAEYPMNRDIVANGALATRVAEGNRGLFSCEVEFYLAQREWNTGDWVRMNFAFGKGSFALSAQVKEVAR